MLLMPYGVGRRRTITSHDTEAKEIPIIGERVLVPDMRGDKPSADDGICIDAWPLTEHLALFTRLLNYLSRRGAATSGTRTGVEQHVIVPAVFGDGAGELTAK